jgi:tRNA dimethylallyltransferase
LTDLRQNIPVLVLIGPTAVGKTAISLEIADRWNAEIISGDSMQVYRGMDIGTAKATPDERARIRHHLIDIRDPDEPYSVSDFQKMAREAIADIHSRGKLPFIVGGTGLYIEAACYDFRFTSAGVDHRLREELRRVAETEGPEALFARLRQADPETAERLHPNDVKRVIRALEIHAATGIPLSRHLAGQSRRPLYDLCIICLTMDRQKLYKRIEQRVDQMLEQGLVDEVRALLARGYTRDMVSMQGLGYKEIAEYLEGLCTLEEAVERIKRDTRRFAKRQLSWFRHMRGVHWVDVTDEERMASHLREIHAIIAGMSGTRGEYV